MCKCCLVGLSLKDFDTSKSNIDVLVKIQIFLPVLGAALPVCVRAMSQNKKNRIFIYASQN